MYNEFMVIEDVEKLENLLKRVNIHPFIIYTNVVCDYQSKNKEFRKIKTLELWREEGSTNTIEQNLKRFSLCEEIASIFSKRELYDCIVSKKYYLRGSGWFEEWIRTKKDWKIDEFRGPFLTSGVDYDFETEWYDEHSEEEMEHEERTCLICNGTHYDDDCDFVEYKYDIGWHNYPKNIMSDDFEYFDYDNEGNDDNFSPW